MKHIIMLFITIYLESEYYWKIKLLQAFIKCTLKKEQIKALLTVLISAFREFSMFDSAVLTFSFVCLVGLFCFVLHGVFFLVFVWSAGWWLFVFVVKHDGHLCNPSHS